MTLTAENKAKLTHFALAAAVVGMAAMSLTGVCQAENIQVFPESWQELDPGKPPETRPKIEIVAEGGGRRAEIGDLVQISTRQFFSKESEYGKEREWWLWLGFRSNAETTFFSTNPAQRSVLLGLAEGTKLKFLEHMDKLTERGKLYVNPIGDPEYYGWRKNTRDFWRISIPYESGYTLIEIKRVCKGKAQYRTLRLFDDSYVQRCTFAPIRCEMLNTPREGWVDEAKIEAVCSDGKTATFQYGPVASRNGKEWTGPVNPGNYFTPWEKAAWDKLPVGVQLK